MIIPLCIEEGKCTPYLMWIFDSPCIGLSTSAIDSLFIDNSGSQRTLSPQLPNKDLQVCSLREGVVGIDASSYQIRVKAGQFPEVPDAMDFN